MTSRFRQHVTARSCTCKGFSCRRMKMLLLSAVCVLACLGLGYGDNYYIGRGRADVTGPVVEVEMMGYAMPQQYAHGLHFRQYSRAFIIADAKNSSRIVFINADICMGSQAIKMQVVSRLQKMYGNLYTNDNLLISGIHTHSGPAGYFQYVLFEVMSLGFIEQTLDAIVDGVVLSVQRAHDNMVLGKLLINSGNLTDASINRSPSAYENNPAEERGRYQFDVDHLMTVLKMVDTKGGHIGMIDWFAVHCTSMNNTNRLISGDNKGRASYLMEHDMDPSALPGQSKFVAAFGQSNEGDVSPNTKGPHCLDTGDKCEFYHSTCNNKTENCVAQGPGKDMFDSTDIIARKQYELGKALYQNATTEISGATVDYRHTFINFTNVAVTYDGKEEHTCPPAMGYSFAAGTIDGPGAFDFTQGDTKTNPFWNVVTNILHKPTKTQIDCHAPKPILLDTSQIDLSIFPYPWQPSILPLQLLRVGQLVIVGVPAEFTTMSGRRLRDHVKNALMANGMKEEPIVVIAGLSNTYSDYVVTYEEYQVQRYEGASTVYGPYTLVAYQQEFSKLAAALANGSSVPAGPDPPNYLDKQVSFIPNVLFDGVPPGKHYGQLRQDAKKSYKLGDTVEVRFWAGNPRNDLMQEKTFLSVEKKGSDGNFSVMYTDASWETKFEWHHTSVIIGELLGESEAVVLWDIPSDASAGTYRIRHFGHHKKIGSGKISPYEGSSSEFAVTA